MENDDDIAVSEVREWRRQVMESWKGKSWEEIQKELNERGDEFRKEKKEKRNQKMEGAA